jgi:PAS domain S-box-containing protein
LTQEPQAPITVLVVDDEEPIRLLLEAALKQHGFHVLLAASGTEALELKSLQQADVALIDIYLSGKMDGHAVLRELNQIHPDMSKILMSGQAGLDDAIAAFSEQAFSFARKPFSSLKEVVILVERAAQAKRLTVQNREFARSLQEANLALEMKVNERTAEMQRYQGMLSHLFWVSSRIALLDQPDHMLEFVCQSIVEAGAFKQVVILVGDEKFRIRHVGVWVEGGVPDDLKESLRLLKDQPLRPYEFDVREEQIGSAILTRTLSRNGMGSEQEIMDWRAGDRVSIPMMRHDGTIFGYLSVTSPVDGRKPSVEIIQLLVTLLSHGALQIEAHELQQQLKRRAEDLERRVQERTSELRYSEEKFSRLVNSTTDIVYIADENDKIIYLNEAFTSTLGYIRENYIGRPLRLLFEELATDNPTNRRAIQALESFAGEHTIHHVELLTRQGDKRMLEINRTIVRQGGVLKGSQGIIRDITEQRALLQQLITAERLAATGRLAAGVAHEINNPLQAISSHLSTAVKKFRSQEDPAQNLELISEGIDRIRQIVRGMLDLHRGPTIQAPLNLNEITRKVVTLVGKQLREASIDLNLDLAADLPNIEGSPQEIQQVILNLTLNAIEAMPQGGKLGITTAVGEHSIDLSVEDSGVGIPQEHLSQIFEPFFTYRSAGNGTGLGLYLSKNIMELHHGTISVVSEKGWGSRFTLSFPKK